MLRLVHRRCYSFARTQAFTTSASLPAPKIPPRYIVNEKDITEVFIHGSGPGGQKINKTASAVQLKHLPTNTVIKCQATRSRSQNRKIARRLLGDKIEAIENPEGSRVKVKGEVRRKKERSAGKKRRRKYRALGEGEGEEDNEGDEGDGDEGEGEDGDEGEGENRAEGWVRGGEEGERGEKMAGKGEGRVR